MTLTPVGGGLSAGGRQVGPLHGWDQVQVQALLSQSLRGSPGGARGLFAQELGPLFLGGSARGGSVGAALHAGEMRFNPYCMNPSVMVSLPYTPLSLGSAVWK